MDIINDYNFPILKYLGCTPIVSHKDFRGIFRKLEDSEITEDIKKEQDKLNAHGDAYGLIQKPTAKRRAAWPFLSLDEDMYKRIGDETLHQMDQTFNYFWSMDWSKKTPIVITPRAWKDSFYNAPEGYDDWIRRKAEEGYIQSGIFLHPHGITQMFEIIWDKSEDGIPIVLEACFTLGGKDIVSFNVNHNGFISKNISFESDQKGNVTPEDIARERGVDTQTVYFQEEMYNILRLLYYFDAYRMKPRTLTKGDTVFEGTGIKHYSDTPVVVMDMPVRN